MAISSGTLDHLPTKQYPRLAVGHATRSHSSIFPNRRSHFSLFSVRCSQIRCSQIRCSLLQTGRLILQCGLSMIQFKV
ncbi:MAG: hypothetical protein F6K26_38425 [Moorea sp. SIO2I5]|nr:hypothetical protein [Moorena sp. SIO2I5]